MKQRLSKKQPSILSAKPHGGTPLQAKHGEGPGVRLHQHMRLLDDPHYKHTLHMANVFTTLHLQNTALMIRTVIMPQQQNISIDLPQDYVEKKVEVIAFTIEDVEPSDKTLAKDWLTPEEDAAWHNL